MERKETFIEGEYYHLYNRGVDKRTIFPTARDYKRFLMLLYLANSEEEVHIANILKSTTFEDIFVRDRGQQLVAIGAYCLMPNHFHIVIAQLVDGGIARFMLKLQTAYSMYFNTKHERKGSLFQGPYRSVHAEDDRYLKYLFSYVHLNPAKIVDPQWKERVGSKHELQRFVESYPYSSYGAYLNNTHIITNPSKFPEYFLSKKDVTEHITDWLASEDVE